jgi:hypothetical protein
LYPVCRLLQDLVNLFSTGQKHQYVPCGFLSLARHTMTHLHVYIEYGLDGRLRIVTTWFLEVANLDGEHAAFQADDWGQVASTKHSLTASSLALSEPSALVLKYSKKSSLPSAVPCHDLRIDRSRRDDDSEFGSFPHNPASVVSASLTHFLRRPNKRSVYAPRSCASSTWMSGPLEHSP